jgi:type II secretory pathway pseudopilin PulG
MLKSIECESPLRSVAAFSLIELTLALSVAAFCLLAVIGLMPVGVQTNRNSTSQTFATNIAALVVADLRAAKTASPMLGITPIPADPTSPPQFIQPDVVPCSGGQTSATSQVLYFDSQGQCLSCLHLSTSNSLYRVIVTFVKNTTATATTGSTYVNVKVTWPAAIDPCVVTPSGSVEMFAALDRN